MDDENCDIKILLSHIGADQDQGGFSDMELALHKRHFDIIFSGHEHHFNLFDQFEKVKAPPDSRLNLVCKGVAHGVALCWAKLVVNTETRSIVSHESGCKLLDNSVLPDPKITGILNDWKAQFEAPRAVVVGHTDKEIVRPAQGMITGPNESPAHAVLLEVMTN